jgi:hypothetical protein
MFEKMTGFRLRARASSARDAAVIRGQVPIIGGETETRVEGDGKAGSGEVKADAGGLRGPPGRGQDLWELFPKVTSATTVSAQHRENQNCPRCQCAIEGPSPGLVSHVEQRKLSAPVASPATSKAATDLRQLQRRVRTEPERSGVLWPRLQDAGCAAPKGLR